MRQTIKDLLPAIVLSITISFMLFIFEPITMYANNPNDFWFDLRTIAPVIIPSAFVFSLYVLTPILLCYIIFKSFFKKPGIYYTIVAVLFCVFLITYIQGNFLANSLPGINGDLFNWREYKTESLVSIILWVVVFAVLLISLVKLKPAKVFSVVPVITSAVFIMLGVSLVSTIFTTNVLEDKITYTYTYDNFNLASSNQNLFIFLVDAIDAKELSTLINSKNDSHNLFKDFTFYEDALSFYPFTRDSIPYIFNHVPNHNETNFLDYARETLSGSNLFKTLKSNDFNMNYYDVHDFMNTETALNFQNVAYQAKVEPKILLEQIIKFDLFKYLPYPLKGKAHIEDLNFASTKKAEDYERFDCGNVYNYQKITSNNLSTTDDKVFHFIYTEGSHVPFNLDENLNRIPNNSGTYTQKVKATYKLIEAYLNRLKKFGVYDNSAIVILADHGYDVTETSILNRYNPALLIKGVNEVHSEMLRSDKPIEYSDLEAAFIQLSQKDTSQDLFNGISYPRTRKFIHYRYTHEDHMVEYETDGKAWESDKMRKTGNVYDLKE